MIEVLLQAESALHLGLLDRAEVLYEQVRRADPRNAIAVVGLARVALERGHQEAALDLAWQALAIDEQNVAARRLAQRLEEVIGFDGGRRPGEGTRTEAPEPPRAEPPAADASQAPVPERRSWRDRLLRRGPLR